MDNDDLCGIGYSVLARKWANCVARLVHVGGWHCQQHVHVLAVYFGSECAIFGRLECNVVSLGE